MDVSKEEFDNAYLLTPGDSAALYRRLQAQRPEFAEKFVRRWWWWNRCRRDVLVVTDSFLDFSLGPFGLSEFLKAFNALEAQSWVDYRVTTAHRQSAPAPNNPVVVQHVNNFRFDSVNLGDFDEVWIFGADVSSAPLSQSELDAVEQFMDNGGGLFATGDHASFGKAMGDSIPRVKDMRYWDDFGIGEVSVAGARRNDTNQPPPGSAVSSNFDDQSDETPQTIAVRTFGTGRPHPLLSISPTLRPSRLIDVMPDHPHEGECKEETSFTVKGVSVPTQHIATSMVRGGTSGAGKQPTDPHCFPSIAVWDGWKASAGRIVVDSTWHHFVNINLNGVGSTRPGLDQQDWLVVRQYFMNIATWMSRRTVWWCWWRRLVFELVAESQLVEASVEVAVVGPREAPIKDLRSIGALAEELLAARFTPGYARDFLLGMLGAEASEDLASVLESWAPVQPEAGVSIDSSWIDLERLMHIAVGAGFAAVRTSQPTVEEGPEEEELESIPEIFNEGLEIGLQRGLEEALQSVGRTFERIRA